MSHKNDTSQLVEDTIPGYLERLTRVPLLSSAEEIALTRMARDGNETARTRLIEANMRLVVNIAKNYKCKLIPMEDLVQEGAIGLMQATQRFDPDRGFRFSTYATHWIRQAIGRAVDNKAKTIRLPAHITQVMRQIERDKAIFIQQFGKEPSIEELSEFTKISERRLKIILNSAQEMLSLDTPLGDRFGSTLGAVVQDVHASNPEDCAVRNAIASELQNVIYELNEREQQVMELKYRNDGTTMKLDQVAKTMKISPARVRLLENSALRKIRLIAHERHLTDLI
jgi:RNA polymerase primary sigma factor